MTVLASQSNVTLHIVTYIVLLKQGITILDHQHSLFVIFVYFVVIQSRKRLFLDPYSSL